jgi:pimeloyl-ACP methyl ester carboxylesterase
MIQAARSMVTVLAAIFLSLLFAAAADAAGFTITYSGPAVSGTITVIATPNGDGTFTVISASGSQNFNGITQTVTGIIPLTDGANSRFYFSQYSYDGYDNQLMPAAATAVDVYGLLLTFSGVNGPVLIDYDPDNRYGDGVGYQEGFYVGSDGNDSLDSSFTNYPITTFTVVAQSVTFLDPVSTLFVPATSNITTDLNTLATAGRAVSGVAADGVTQLLLRVGGLTQGQQVNVSIVDETNGVPATGEDGKLSVPLGGTVAGPASVSPTPQFASAINGYDGFVLYQAPIDFVRASGLGAGDLFLGGHQVTIQVTDTNNTVLTSAPLLILRPPVFFVHGLWGDPGTWDQWNTYLTGIINGISTYKADFEQTNGLGVDRNTPTVLSQAEAALQSFRDSNNAAAAQLDFIVHSMGGLISNNMVKEPAWATPDNYGTGYIHKLITVDTPYQGSPLAVYTAKSSPACKQELAGKGQVVATAIRDLIPTSAFLQNFTIPSGLYYKHAIASYVTAQQSTTAGNSVDNLDLFVAGLPNPVYSECLEIFNAPVGNGPPNFSFPTYFLTPGDPYKGESDLVVSVLSQLGPATQPFTVGSTAHTTSGLAHSHAVLPLFGTVLLPGSLDANFGSPIANPDLGIALLNSPVASTGANSFVH